jgi:hypothetical protein
MTSSTVLDRESIYTRVFAYFTALTDGHAVTPLFRSATRKPGTWENYSPEECPALLMRETREQARREKFRPTVWTLYIDLLIFINTGWSTPSRVCSRSTTPRPVNAPSAAS